MSQMNQGHPTPFPKVTSIASRHDAVTQGGAYFAIKGAQHNGEDYIQLAIAQGAKVIYRQRSEPDVSTIDGVTYISVPDIRATLAMAAAHQYPLQPENIMLVTGTSGKTSVVEYCRQLASALGHESASLGSIGLVSPIKDLGTHETLTTPDPIQLHQLLDKMARLGVTHLAMEASSHGIWQHRLDGVRFKGAGFTNFSHEHLDYHGTMEAYFQAKSMLFAELLPAEGVAVLNADIPYYKDLQHICKERGIEVLDYGRHAKQIVLKAFKPDHLELEILGKSYKAAIHLDAEFQAYNIMCALGLMLSVEGRQAAQQLMAAVPKLKCAKGRLDKVGTYHGSSVYVDHAHKPDALMKVLLALRERCTGRLVVVFGCGGDRDKTKRPIMGEIAAQYADVVIVTDDNPRTEVAANIRQEIMQGCHTALEIAGRATAIQQAMAMLQEGDTLLIAGKGHEEYQIIGDQHIPYSDFAEVLGAIERN